MISRCKGLRYPFACPRTLFKYATVNPSCGIGISNKSFDRPYPDRSSSYPAHRAGKHSIIFSCTSPAFPSLGNVIFFSPGPFNVSSISSLVDGGQHWPALARQMNERDQEAFAAWQPLACDVFYRYDRNFHFALNSDFASKIPVACIQISGYVLA